MRRRIIHGLLKVMHDAAEATVVRRQHKAAEALARYGRGSHWMSASWSALRQAEANRDVIKDALERFR